MQQQGYKRAPRNSHEETVIDPAFPPPSLIKTTQRQQKTVENNNGKQMEKRKKKEKKWSLGGLFRRRKNKDTTTDTDSSSLSDKEHAAVKKGFLERRRSARKKRNRGSKDVTGSFEHVIIKRQNNEETVNNSSSSSHMLGVPRDVSSDRAGSRSSHDSLNKKHHHHFHETSFIRGSSVSLEGTSRRSGRQQVKARVEASRDRLCADSSSDEGNSSRNSTSSVQRFRSDENLGGGVKDGSLSRKSRAARTERYNKRLSRDEEAFKEFNLDASAPRVSRSDEKLTTINNISSSSNNNHKKNELKVPTNNRWTAKVVYQESSDYDTKYTAKTKSATPSPIQSPKVRPKNALHFTSSAPAAIQNYSTTFPPSHTQQQQRGEGFISVSTQDFSTNNKSLHSSGAVNKFPHKQQQQVFSSGAFVTPPRLPRSGSNSETNRHIAAETVPTTTTRLYYNNNNNNNNSSSDNVIFNQKKSASFDSSINHSHMFNNSSSKSIMHPDPTDSNVLVVQFPIGRSTAGGGRKEVMKDTTGVVVQQSTRLKQQNPPPPPPPRDPQRKVFHVNGGNSQSEAAATVMSTTSTRPMSYAFENRTKPRVNNNKTTTDYNSNNVHMMNYNSSGGRQYQNDAGQTHHHGVTPGIKQHHRSNSDQQLLQSSSFNHHYATENSPPVQRRTTAAASVQRSPSVDVALAANRIPRHYQYYTDQQPRSRKPIQPVAASSIQNQRVSSINDQPYLSDSQMVIKPPYQQVTRVRPVQHATEFWRQKEQESGMKMHVSDGSPKLIQKHLLHTAAVNNQERSQSASPRHDVVPVGYGRPRLPPLVIPSSRGAADSTSSLSGQSDLSASPRVAGHHFKLAHNEIGIPVYDSDPVVDGGQNKDRPLSMVLEKSESGEQHDMMSSAKKDKTPPAPPQRRYSKTLSGNTSESDQKYSSNSNLEEALSELEAIYKSLRLGEEALLEKRGGDLSADPAGNKYDPSNWSAWVKSRGFESDSSFNYSRSSSVDSSSVDSPLRRRVTSGCRKSTVPDRVTDDMAYRRLNKKDRTPSLEQNVISQAGSFLLVSPTLSPPPFVESPPPTPPVQQLTQEPDITLDDVVYRNIKHMNNTLKITDPQPPFGIPLGPISPAPNSDYLHVIPKERYRSTFKPRKTPDIVTDDLAFRNLRKDGTRTVPMFAPEDGTTLDSTALRRNRAVRSLSANLLSIIQKDAYSKYFNNGNNNKSMSNYNLRNGGGGGNDLEKSQSFSDLPDALAIAHRILDEKENLMMTGSNLLRVKNRSKRSSVNNDDPDVTPRASRCSDVSSLGVGTSTETLTDSRVNLRSHDEPSQQTSSYGRLSATPERKTGAADGLHQSEKLSSTFDNHSLGSNRYSVTPEKITTKQNDSSRSYGVVRSQGNFSGSRDSTSLTQSDNELLDFLAKEARATSEQIGRELKELSNEKPEKKKLDKTLSNSNNTNSNNKQVPQNSFSSNSPSKNNVTIGKVVHHKPVRLNTFSITEDNVLENKTIISSKSIEDLEESNSKSMTDLLKELTRCLDSDFGGGGGGATTDDNTNKSTSPSVCSRQSILEDDDDSKPPQRTCDPNIITSNSNDKESSPNISKRTASLEKKNSENAEKLSYDDDDDDSNSKYVNKIRKTASSLSKLSETAAAVDQQDDDYDEGENQVVKSSSIKLSLNLGSSLLSDIKQQPSVGGSDNNGKGELVNEEQNNSRLYSDDIVKNEDDEHNNKSGISSNKSRDREHMRDKSNTGDEKEPSVVFNDGGDDEDKKNNIKCNDDGSDNNNDSVKKRNDKKKKVEDNSSSTSSSSTPTHLVYPSSSSKKQGGDNQRGDQCSTTTANEGTTSKLYPSSSTVFLVCSYCMACVHQLAGLDCLTVFGLLLAMASVILFLIT